MPLSPILLGYVTILLSLLHLQIKFDNWRGDSPSPVRLILIRKKHMFLWTGHPGFKLGFCFLALRPVSRHLSSVPLFSSPKK